MTGVPRVDMTRLTAFLSGRWAPLVVGGVTALAIWWVWGSLRQIPLIHDETAYVLQAEIFAAGRWTAPGRPLPGFFEQFQVFVTPVLASKYPPGHSLLLVPGIWLGSAGLVPVALSGLTGALLFVLARRFANGWVALLAWLLWLTSRGNLSYRPAYYSEVTTGAAWLLAWWALLEWRATGRRRWLLAVAASVGWGAITRPLTTLAFAIPVAVVVLRLGVARRAWRDLGLALALGAAILGIVPLWSARTTGDWKTTPYALYSRIYFPQDAPGFGLEPESSHRALPADMQGWAAEVRQLQSRHTVGALPRTLWRRLARIVDDLWHGWRAVFLPFVLLGVVGLCAEATFALATAGLLVLAYLTFAHWAHWSVYYLELQPVLAFITALGVWRALSPLDRPASAHRRTLASLLLFVALIPPCFAALPRAHAAKQLRQSYKREFQALLRDIPAPKAIVFVRYGPRHNVHYSLIANEPDLDRARVWVVYDRGPENARLMRLAPDRVPYLYDEAQRTLLPLPLPTASP